MGGRSRLHCDCSGADAAYFILKLTLGVSATLFSMLGLIIMCVGIYAEVERQQNKTMEGFFVAPAVILVVLGVSIFALSFIGMVGALRDNRLLLKIILEKFRHKRTNWLIKSFPAQCKSNLLLPFPWSLQSQFKWTLVTVVVLEFIFIIVCFLFRNKVLLVFKANVREGIRHYYEDLDFKNILDRIQTKFSCCGGDEYTDWKVNLYHDCDAPGPMACGVPYTCCIQEEEDEVVNTQCGYLMLKQEHFEVDKIIHVRGCIDAINLWFEDNVIITVGILAAIILPQMLGIFLSCLYLIKLSQYKDEVDGFRVRIPFEQLDLSGAGWCLCLPKAEGYQAMEEPVDPYSMNLLQDTQVMDTKEEELN
ncbi:tetraspanin-15-like isoform X1 [Mobula birostris]|uniref:tetraspanin-15-like isoform X1 n=1 Tax=Mobula birostris TaxID=1983395 RepID=UPI003B2840F2